VKVLVTGATGYLGAEIVRALLVDGNEVIALSRSLEKFEQLRRWCDTLEPQLRILEGDICTLRALPQGIGTIIHAAARLGVKECGEHRAETVRVNVHGTCNILRLAARHGVKRFIYISTQSIYGRHPPPWSEEVQPDPQGVYALTKYAGEGLVRAFRDDLDLAILRLARLYGVSLFMRWDELIGKFVRMIHEGLPLPVFGDGTQRFDLLHVRDAAQCVARLLKIYPEGWNEIYNVGGGGSISLNELVERLAQIAMELDLPPVEVERRLEISPTGPSHCELDITRARKRLGWMPRQALQEGLQEYLQAYAQ